MNDKVNSITATLCDSGVYYSQQCLCCNNTRRLPDGMHYSSTPWICDECNVELVGRSDDNEESFKVRFETYVKNTEPLLDFYRELGKLVIIDYVCDWQ